MVVPKYRGSFLFKNSQDKKYSRRTSLAKIFHFLKNKLVKDIPYTISKNIRNAINNIYKDYKIKQKLQKEPFCLVQPQHLLINLTILKIEAVYFKNLDN